MAKIGKAVAQGLATLHGWNRARSAMSNEQLAISNEDRAVQGASAVGAMRNEQLAMMNEGRTLAGESGYLLTEEVTRLSEAGEKGTGALAGLHGWNRAGAKDFSCIEDASHGIVSTVLEKPASPSARADEASDTEPSKR